MQKYCICGKKVFAVKKKHLTNMDGSTGNWLLFVHGNGITWVRDGSSESDAAPASGYVASRTEDTDFKLKHAVDIGGLAEAPLCPANHAETSLPDFINSSDRLKGLKARVWGRSIGPDHWPQQRQAGELAIDHG